MAKKITPTLPPLRRGEIPEQSEFVVPKESEFRVVETGKGFYVQRNFAITKKHRRLFRPTEITVSDNWRNVTEEGQAPFYALGISRPRMAAFETLQEAYDFIKVLTCPPKIHPYPPQ